MQKPPVRRTSRSRPAGRKQPLKPKPASTEEQLSKLARHVVVPEGAVTTGWPRVKAACAALGVSFDPWQDLAGRLALSKLEDGQYAAGVGGVTMSLPRQVGKTYFVGWTVVGMCLTEPGLTVIWTAHHSRTANEVFESMQGMAETPAMRPHVAKVTAGAGTQSVRFHNGSRIMFGARESGFGRGFAGVDVLVFDEAQILSERAIDDMVAAQNTASNALTFMIGTPPKPTDPSEAFTRARREALEGVSVDALYIEFGAERGANPDSPATWKVANPSHPRRTSKAAMMRLRRKLTEESFIREGLGTWDELPGQEPSAFPMDSWDRLGLSTVPESWPLAGIGLDMNPERTRITVAVAAWSPSGVHVELVDTTDEVQSLDERAIVAWVWARVKRRIPVVMDAFSPARSLEGPLKARGVKVRAMSAGELAQACGGFHDAVAHGGLSHFGQDVLRDSLRDSVKVEFGKSGAWKVRPRGVDSDITGAMAAISAHFGAAKFGRRPTMIPTEPLPGARAQQQQTRKVVADVL